MDCKQQNIAGGMAGMTIHFGPPAKALLPWETTKELQFVGMPAGTVLLSPMSVRIQR